jgi:hypothetical protein
VAIQIQQLDKYQLEDRSLDAPLGLMVDWCLGLVFS